MRRINVELPNQWELHADSERRPLLVHPDGRRLEPKDAALEGDAQALYRALKLEEDRRGRLWAGVESDFDFDWIVIWSARVVIGDFFNRKVSKGHADQLLHEETEKAVRREQEERARLWLH